MGCREIIPRSRLTKTSVTVPEALPFGEHLLVPFRAGEKVAWVIANG